MRRYAWAFALGLAFVLGCGEDPPVPEPVVRPVKIWTVGGDGDRAPREYPGEIGPAQNAELGFVVSGKIIELPIEEADDVEEGAVLARLDARDFETRLEVARADMDKARANFDRARTLFEQDVLAASEFDSRKAAFEAAEASHREAQKAVEDAVLRAPFAGTVARILAEDFQTVQAKEPVVLLQDDSSLEIVVDIPERDVASGPGGPGEVDKEAITASLQPEVIVTSLPNRVFPARAKEFATSADPETRTFQATFALAAPDDVRVLPGMTAKVRLHLDAERAAKVIRVPARAAIADEAGDPFVWRVDLETMTVSRTPVGLGDMGAEQVTVTSGLSAGDAIAVSGLQHLREGMQVRRLGD